MDARIASTSRPDVMMIESTGRPTPTPARVSFGQLLAAGANGLVQGAELVAGHVPAAPIAVAAVRGGVSTAAPLFGAGATVSSGLAEGPSAASGVTPGGATLGMTLAGLPSGVGGLPPTGAGSDPASGIDASLQQSAQMNLYYLHVQQEVDSQNRSFTALSNVLKTEHDSAKAAIQNVHS